MVAYLALTWTRDAPPTLDAVRRSLAGRRDWNVVADDDGALIAVRGPVWPSVRRLPGARGWVIGDLFRRGLGAPIGVEVESLTLGHVAVSAAAKDLCANYWGRYVALIRPRPAGPVTIFRDPSGAVDALTWEAGGFRVVASHLPDLLPRTLWPDLRIDWTAVAQWLLTASAAAVRSGLAGVVSVTPGAMIEADGAETQIWRPVDVVRADVGTAAEAAAALPPLLDACVRALAARPAPILAEISGGLDSAIVAASLAGQARDQVRAWTNYYAAEGEGDERIYAREVARRLDITLTETLKPAFTIGLDLLAAGATGLRPGFGSLDGLRDRDGARRATELGVERVFTGQGGDMVFFQTPTPVLAVDHLRRAGLAGLASPYLLDLARWTRRSVWSLASQVLDRRVAWPHEGTVADHPWMRGAEALPPGKRAQIAILAQKLSVNIETLRAQVCEVIHPLLSQPVVEHCLAISAVDLTVGGRDRGLARRAFADRLPVRVTERRGKGELTGYYGRVVGDSLEVLRPYLLEGRLVAAGLIDRDRFDDLLTREHLIWRGETYLVLTTMVVEAWLRHWQGQGAW
jgi:asparagine synthase (glutamine-hydrolysing)